MDESGIAIVVSGETVLAGGVVYVEEGNAIHRFGEAIVVGNGVGLGEEVGNEVRWKRRKSKFSHVGVNDDGKVDEGGCDVRRCV